MKVKYLIAVQCLLIAFTLYMFKDLFIITLPAWLITLPVTVPLLVYLVILYFKKRKAKRAYQPIIKTEEKALLWLANYIHYDFTYLAHRNIVHLEKLTLEKIIELYNHYKDVGYSKHDKDPLLKEKMKGLQWMWSKPPEILRQETHFEIATSHNYDNGRRMETPDNIGEAIKLATTKRNKGDEYDEYHNSKTEIVTKVITVREIVAVIKPEEKH